MPRLNPVTLKSQMAKKFFTQENLANKAKISPNTVAKALTGKNVSIKTLASIAEALGVAPGTLLLERFSENSDSRYRSIEGEWVGIAEDIVVPGHVEYEIEPVTYQLEMEIQHTGEYFHANGFLLGQEATKQHITVEGKLKEDGNFLMLEWSNSDPTLHDYGTGLLEHKANGKQLMGYFIGRERIHGPQFIFGRIDVKRST